MSPVLLSEDFSNGSPPRASGDEPYNLEVSPSMFGSAPRERG